MPEYPSSATPSYSGAALISSAILLANATAPRRHLSGRSYASRKHACWPAWGLALLLTTAFLAAAGGRADAAGDERQLSITDAAESYYTTAVQSLTSIAPVSPCLAPASCPPTVDSPPSIFPPDTLHVGVAAGAEAYRTYVSPDLGALPSDATTATGQMILPVATDAGSGTVSADTAQIAACLVAEPAPDGVAGSTAVPPTIVPGACRPLQYNAKTQAFSVDVTPFLSAWTSGVPNNGLALIPIVASQADDWQVTFNSRHRTGVAHIVTLIQQRPRSAVSPDQRDGALPSPHTPSVTAPGPTTNGLPASNSGVPAGEAPVVAGAGPQPPAQARAFRTTGFLYPQALLVPVAILILGVCLMRVFTAETPVTTSSR